MEDDSQVAKRAELIKKHSEMTGKFRDNKKRARSKSFGNKGEL